ncbi:MAG TPA: tRNA dihydrouridine(20/20a) synthase DusA [Coxiellaceae bacterium]|nr:MAG: tRNA dihydrouridine(20/20a) synthase DusA [Gammaproteobacteria bacterium RIFCSPHIGHO2_12_FULL_36_30]HLB56518.1 tRNA dihydrouridine(20/20a) synthase DusA [Coxiellaceae bacterium]
MKTLNRKICVAPMMAYTDRHFRYLLRLISKHAVLYTEMITAQAIMHGDQPYLLDFSSEEHPVALQLGGSDPALLEKAAKIGEKWGYDEINLNVGCPSERVQNGCFGAALMKEPKLVAQCITAMRNAVSIPVTIKTRLGVDECDSDYFLHDFMGKIHEAGCNVFVMHARKAFLKGLSPKENRDVPPLQYDRVYQLKKLFPQLEIILNGGIQTHDAVREHLKYVDGVMIGRVACSNPYFLYGADEQFSPGTARVREPRASASENTNQSRQEIIKEYLPYILEQQKNGIPIRHTTKHLIGLFQGEIGARNWRRKLSDRAVSEGELMEFLNVNSNINSNINSLG